MATEILLDAITARLAQHVEYSLKRDECARRAIALFESGKVDEGMDVAEEAELWALRAMALEPGNERSNPNDERPKDSNSA
jgi:hypothetical protein